MQPTKKRTIAKCVITAAAFTYAWGTAGTASAYELSQQTLYSAQVDTSISGKVTTALMTPIVEWTSAESEATTREINLGTLKVHAAGIGLAPSAYVVGPCNGAAKFSVTVNGEDAGPQIDVILVDGHPLNGRDEHVIDATETGDHYATMGVDLTKAPMAGEYRTCVGVMALADDAIVAG
ncbi:hypothetical protein H8467_004866 [Salmonella enterica]|nr:hypothetical protein [Salmonella enterica]